MKFVLKPLAVLIVGAAIVGGILTALAIPTGLIL